MRQVVLIMVLWGCFAPGRALAYEDQMTVGVSTGYGLVVGPDPLPSHAWHLGLSGTLGLSDAWSLGTHVSYQLHPSTSPLHVAIVGLEGIYQLDIVRFVPFAGVGVDGLLSVRGGRTSGDFGIHGLVGFDYLINRRWLVGFEVRPYWIVAKLSADLDPFYLTAAFRVSVRFDRPRR